MEVMHQFAAEGVEEIVARAAGGDENISPVVIELHAGPALSGLLAVGDELLLDVEQVEGREGGFVVVAQIVEHDGLRGRAGDGDDARARVVRREPGRLEIQLTLGARRPAVPQFHRVIQARAHELVVARIQRQAGHARRVAFEVPDEAVVVHREVPDAIVDFGRGVDDRCAVVREPRQCAAVFLGFQLFCVRTCFGVEELNRVVGPREEEELARIVEVDGCVGCGGRCFE